MQLDLRVQQVAVAQVGPDQAPQRFGGEQRGSDAGRREDPAERPERKDVPAAQRPPEPGQLAQRFGAHPVTADKGRVDGPCRRPDQHVRHNTAFAQGSQHADLYGAKAAAAGQDERGGHGQRALENQSSGRWSYVVASRARARAARKSPKSLSATS